MLSLAQRRRRARACVCGNAHDARNVRVVAATSTSARVMRAVVSRACASARRDPSHAASACGWEFNGGCDMSERPRGHRAASATSTPALITGSLSASMRARFNEGDVSSQFKQPEVMSRSGGAFPYAAPPTSTYPGTRCRSVRDRHQTHSRERACFNQGDVDSQLKKPGVGPVQDARICAEGGGGDQPAPPPTDVSGRGQSLY